MARREMVNPGRTETAAGLTLLLVCAAMVLSRGQFGGPRPAVAEEPAARTATVEAEADAAPARDRVRREAS